MSNSGSIEKGNDGGAFINREHQGRTASAENLTNVRLRSGNITPGGHPLDRTQPAFPVSHRKL